MTREDGHRFRQTLVATYGLYGKEITTTTLAIWFEALKGYEIEAVSQALSDHLRDADKGQFLPRPADVVRQIDGGTEDVALRAWAKLDHAVRCVGPWQSVVFDDPWIHSAVANIGGWIELGKKRDEEWPFVRNQFVVLYRGARARKAEFPPRLVGISEAENCAKGRAVKPPVLIGNKAKALRVMGAGADAAHGPRPVAEIMLKTGIAHLAGAPS